MSGKWNILLPAEEAVIRKGEIGPLSVKEFFERYPDLDGTGVYIIRGFRDDMIKVGKTRNLANRLNGLQQATPHRLKVLFFEEYGARAAEIEKAAHRLLWPWRAHGEWFRVSEVFAKIAVEGARDRSGEVKKFFEFQRQKSLATDKRKRQEIERKILMEFTDLHDRLPASDCEVVIMGTWR